MIGLVFFGSGGYWLIGRMHQSGLLEPALDVVWSPLDCVYMTVITISTIGFAETLPLPPGMSFHQLGDVRIYTMLLAFSSLLLVGYAVSSATAFLIEGDLMRFWWRRQAMRDISKLEGHIIVCGCGVTGKVVIEELLETGHRVVAVDLDRAALEEVQREGSVISLEGDATQDETLRSAGIERASALAAALPDDKDNLFLLITAKQARAALRVVCLASSDSVKEKLGKAGADAVVSAASIGGLRMASELFRPTVVSFLDTMLRSYGGPVRFAEVYVGKAHAGQTLAEARITELSGLPVLAVRDAGEELVFNPKGERLLAAGTVVVTMAETNELEELQRWLGKS